ncbi:MAG TPA: dehydrogenase, partial [Candidatus Riflebacteria bacterium]|nr:dehydrogenase [Candidatus Riflebacteria bacterium]
MKQILQSLKTGDIELAEVPVPRVKPGALLIQTRRTLISLGTERMLLNFGKAGWIDKARQQPDKVKQVLQKVKTDGLMPTVNAVFNKLDQPLTLGYSNAGKVIAVGEGVFGYKVGDRVVSNGNHAEFVCVSQHLCARIPDNVSSTSACFTVVAAIGLQGIRLINPSLGESVAVMGLGLIGLLSCQILQANGCRVIGFDFDHQKVELARSYGIEAFDLAQGDNPVDLAMNFSYGNGVDAVLITAATTSNDPIQQAPQMCRKR